MLAEWPALSPSILPVAGMTNRMCVLVISGGLGPQPLEAGFWLPASESAEP